MCVAGSKPDRSSMADVEPLQKAETPKGLRYGQISYAESTIGGNMENGLNSNKNKGTSCKVNKEAAVNDNEGPIKC